MAALRSMLSPSCTITIPSPDDTVQQALPNRWSAVGLALPHAVVTPSTEDDVKAIIKYARSNKLQVIPSGGGSAPYIPVNDKTVYVDMKTFDKVALDKDVGIVTIGGGALAGAVIKALAEEEYWTLMPNSSAIGVAGALIGGCFSPWSTTGKGMAIDQLVSLRVITAGGETLTLSPEETPELFNAMCGGGTGLGVITELKLRAFPAAEAGLDNEGGTSQIYFYRAIFPQPEFEKVIGVFKSLIPMPISTQAFLIFMAAPPGLPGTEPGKLVAMINCQYMGSRASFDSVFKDTLFGDDFTKRAVFHQVMPVTIANINFLEQGSSGRGGLHQIYNSMEQTLTTGTILGVVNEWATFTEENRGSGPGNMLIPAFVSWNPEILTRHDTEGKKGWPHRSRGLMVQMNVSYKDEGFGQKAREFSLKALDLARSDDAKQGLPAATFPIHLYKGIPLENAYGVEKLAELRQVKQRWDPERVFWSPSVEGV